MSCFVHAATPSPSRTLSGRNRWRRNCPISAPAAAARRRSTAFERIGPGHAGIDLRADAQSCARRGACTTAPAVSPPATTSRRTPRATSPSAMRASACSTSAPAARGPGAPAAGDLVGRRRRGDHHRRRADLVAPPSRAPARRARGIRRGQRIELRSIGTCARANAELRQCGARAGTGEHRRRACHRRQRARIAAQRQQPRAAEILRQSHATPEPPVISAWPAAASPIATRCASVDRIDDGVAAPLFLQRGHARADRASALFDRREGHQPDRAVGLARQHAHQVGVGHRRQRMVLHAAFVQQRAADEQMALVDTCAHWSGTPGRRARSRRPSASISASATGPILPCVGAVEGGAVFEEKLSRPGGAQPARARARLSLTAVADGCGAGLERDHHGIGVGRRFARGRDADHAAPCACRRAPAWSKIGRAGEIVGDGA